MGGIAVGPAVEDAAAAAGAAGIREGGDEVEAVPGGRVEADTGERGPRQAGAAVGIATIHCAPCPGVGV